MTGRKVYHWFLLLLVMATAAGFHGSSAEAFNIEG